MLRGRPRLPLPGLQSGSRLRARSNLGVLAGEQSRGRAQAPPADARRRRADSLRIRRRGALRGGGGGDQALKGFRRDAHDGFRLVRVDRAVRAEDRAQIHRSGVVRVVAEPLEPRSRHEPVRVGRLARVDVAAFVGVVLVSVRRQVLRVRRLFVVTQTHARRSRYLRDSPGVRFAGLDARARLFDARRERGDHRRQRRVLARHRRGEVWRERRRLAGGGGATAGTRVETLRSRVLVVVDPFVDQQVRVRGGVRPGAERPAVLALHDRLAERAAAQRGDLLVVEAPPRVARGFGHGFGFFVSESRRLRARASVPRRALRPHERDVVPAGSVLPAMQQDGLQRVRTAGVAFRPGTPRPVVSRAAPPGDVARRSLDEVAQPRLVRELKRVRALAPLERLEVEHEPLQLERQVPRETAQTHRARRVGQNPAMRARVPVIALQALDGEKLTKRVAQTKGGLVLAFE